VAVLGLLAALIAGIALWSGGRVHGAMERQEAAERQYRELVAAAEQAGDMRARIVADTRTGGTPSPETARRLLVLVTRVVHLAEDGGDGATPEPSRLATAAALRGILTASADGRLHAGALAAAARREPALRRDFGRWQESTAARLDAARADVRHTLRAAGVALAAGLVAALALGSLLWLLVERARRGSEAELDASGRRFASLVRHASDLVLVVGDDGTVRYHSPSCEVLTGPGGDLVGAPFADLVHRADRALATALQGRARASGEPQRETLRLGGPGGGWLDMEVVANDMSGDPAVRATVLTARDVTERTRMEAELVHRAFRDPLTGIANRARFEKRLAHALGRCARTGRPLAMLLLDLDDFRTFNDSIGHGAGDRILMEVARRLEGVVRDADTPARLGGDEFALLLETFAEGPGLADVMRRVLHAVEQPMVVDGLEVSLTCCAGVAVTPCGGDTPTDLLRAADIAMYAAKAEGPGRWRVFEPSMRDRAETRLALRAELERALDRGELRLDYQPIVRLDDGSTAGVEALIRWTHPRRGPISPAQFIPLAEASGAITRIGQWVLQRACADAARWIAMGADPGRFSVAVNVSPRQLEQDGLADQVDRALRATGIPARMLLLEITEGVLMLDPGATAARLEALRALGVRVAIDDFGTGYSSLARLARLPVDVVKVDRAFTALVDEPDGEGEFARGVIGLVGALHRVTVAEGVEHPGQVTRLRELGCELGQGYWFSGPLPVAEMDDLLVRGIDAARPVGLLHGG
jgi:diguanylate cyclase (GGDEF)-like protein/PAS domain S-box-containing protein